MISRTPSLRELRANRPDNVEILPTAAPRQVSQPCNAASRKVRQALKQRYADRFDYRFPGERAQDERAAIISEARMNPALMLAMMIFEVLDTDQRNILTAKLKWRAECGGPTRAAFELVSMTKMTVGEQMNLSNAMQRLREKEQ